MNIWNDNPDPIGDLRAHVKEIENEIGLELPAPFQNPSESVRESIQSLYIFGWKSAQVVKMLQEWIEKYRRKHGHL